MCRESRLSCIYLPNSVTLWCRTLWCYYCCGGACKVEHLLGPWQLPPPASLSFPTTTFGASSTPSAKIWPWKQHLNLLVGHLLNQVSGDWSGTLSGDLCSLHCIFRSIEMLSDIFFDAPRGKFHWFCGELIVISNKYDFGILFTMSNYVMHIPGIFHCNGQALSRQSTGSGGHYRLSTVGLPEQSWWSLYQWCQNDHMTALAVQCKGTW